MSTRKVKLIGGRGDGKVIDVTLGVNKVQLPYLIGPRRAVFGIPDPTYIGTETYVKTTIAGENVTFELFRYEGLEVDLMLQRLISKYSGEVDPWDILQTIGVSYQENLGGRFESEFPHSCYSFSISIDRDVMIARIEDGVSGGIRELACVPTRGNKLVDAFRSLVDELQRRFG